MQSGVSSHKVQTKTLCVFDVVGDLNLQHKEYNTKLTSLSILFLPIHFVYDVT